MGGLSTTEISLPSSRLEVVSECRCCRALMRAFFGVVNGSFQHRAEGAGELSGVM